MTRGAIAFGEIKLLTALHIARDLWRRRLPQLAHPGGDLADLFRSQPGCEHLCSGDAPRDDGVQRLFRFSARQFGHGQHGATAPLAFRAVTTSTMNLIKAFALNQIVSRRSL